LYGLVQVSPLCLSFLDTAEMQRLRFVRQLGHVHYVYPSATHSRLEHSLGVMYLAQRMVASLSRRTEISPREAALIELGALMHDAGHCAFSHLYDAFTCTRHEERSVLALQRINARIARLTAAEELFVTNIILGQVPLGHQRPFLFEIVCNAECGVDVDKMDYLQRDAYHTGMHGFSSDFIIQCARVSEGHIAFPEKARSDLEDLFNTRQRMHATVYRHPTVRKIDKLFWCMMTQAGELKADTDASLEEQLRAYDLFNNLIERKLEHDCENCHDCGILHEPIGKSGSIGQVRFE
jgi:HD superfamily phosphohydrolase